MTPIEKSKLIDVLFSLRKADQELMESERKRIESDCKRLASLAFNRFVLDTLLYRESYHILDEKIN